MLTEKKLKRLAETVVAGVVTLSGVIRGGAVDVLANEPSPTTPQDKKVDAVRTNSAFTEHVFQGRYQDERGLFQIRPVDEARREVESLAPGCVDSDWDLETKGRDPFEKGTVTLPGKTPFTDYCSDPYCGLCSDCKQCVAEGYCYESNYEKEKVLIIDWVSCQKLGAVCQDGRCVRKIFLPLVAK